MIKRKLKINYKDVRKWLIKNANYEIPFSQTSCLMPTSGEIVNNITITTVKDAVKACNEILKIRFEVEKIEKG